MGARKEARVRRSLENVRQSPHPFDSAQGRLCRIKRDKGGAPRGRGNTKVPPRRNAIRVSRHDTISAMRKLSLSDYRALAEFRYQIRKFLRFSERAVRAAGVETRQYQLMLAIKGMPEGERPRIRELANRMQIQHHSAVELVNRLEAGGYVRRERGRNDRREVLLGLTAKGERVLEELALHHHEELRSTAPDLVAALRRVTPRTARLRSG